jgi:hypothetical protein
LQKKDFERFDFSEIQQTDRSLSRGRLDSTRNRLEEANRKNEELTKEIEEVRELLSRSKAQNVK